MVKFLMDYRGVLTKEAYYRAEDIVSLPGLEAALVAAGRAIYAGKPGIEPVPSPQLPPIGGPPNITPDPDPNITPPPPPPRRTKRGKR